MASQGKTIFQRGWSKKSSWYTIAANFYQWYYTYCQFFTELTLCLFSRLFHQAFRQWLWSNGREWSCARYMGQSPSIRENLKCIRSSIIWRSHGAQWICQWPSCMGCDSRPSSYRPSIFVSNWTHAVGSSWTRECHNLSPYWLWRWLHWGSCGRWWKAVGVPSSPSWQPFVLCQLFPEGQLSPWWSLAFIRIWFWGCGSTTWWQTVSSYCHIHEICG